VVGPVPYHRLPPVTKLNMYDFDVHSHLEWSLLIAFICARVLSDAFSSWIFMGCPIVFNWAKREYRERV
jgi:hypothetical protein